MKIQNSQNLINFNGLYFKKVSPKVRQAFAECPVIKNISEGVVICRSPHGLRGLKYVPGLGYNGILGSQPSWAAWIEINIWTA